VKYVKAKELNQGERYLLGGKWRTATTIVPGFNVVALIEETGDVNEVSPEHEVLTERD